MKKALSFLLAAAAALSMAGCSGQTSQQATAENSSETSTSAAAGEADSPSSAAAASSEADALSGVPADIRVGSLKGPTSMGLVFLMDKNEAGEAGNHYDFTMATAADEITGKLIKGDLDIALVPANVASILYHKTEGNVTVLDINTLGVLYLVSADTSIQSVADLKGRTVYLTGMGTTPDYVFQYLLKANGLTAEDVTLEYKSEAAEVAALLKENPDSIGLLPQPFVTAAMAQNDQLSMVLDLTEEWNHVQEQADGSSLVTGVTIVRTDFLEEHPEAVNLFLKEHEESTLAVMEDLDTASQLVADLGIIEKAPVAKKAIPYCNITCIQGSEMQSALSGYLNVLFEQDPSSVGGSLPADDFYYIP